MPTALEEALEREREVVITTYDADGRPGSVPIWFVHVDGRVYMATGRESRKVRKLRADPRVRLRVGGRGGPEVSGLSRVRQDAETWRRVVPVLNARYDGGWGSDEEMLRELASGVLVLLEVTLDRVKPDRR